MISIENLTKRFGDRIAVAGIDLEIKDSEIFGLLGPNGAGKTTTVRILTLLSQKNSGTVKIAGFDIEKTAKNQRHHWRGATAYEPGSGLDR